MILVHSQYGINTISLTHRDWYKEFCTQILLTITALLYCTNLNSIYSKYLRFDLFYPCLQEKILYFSFSAKSLLIAKKWKLWIRWSDCYSFIFILYLIYWPSGSRFRQWSGRPGFNPRSRHTKDFKNSTWYFLA